MGLDLTLLPIQGTAPYLFANTHLECFRRQDLFLELSFESIPLNYAITTLCQNGRGEFCYEDTREDQYGNDLEYMLSGDISEYKTHEEVKDCPINRAVWAYIEQLPKETKIVLYWN